MGKYPILKKLFEMFIQEITKRLNIHGGCKMLSIGADKCDCPKCQIYRMDMDEILDSIEAKIKSDKIY